MSGPDIPYAIQTFLQADPGVQEAVMGLTSTGAPVTWPPCGQGGIFLLELDPTLDPVMPVECVVIDAGGGDPGIGAGSLYVQQMRILVSCYGRTLHLAYVLHTAVYLALKNMDNQAIRHTVMQGMRPLTGGNALREPYLQWPYVTSSWQAMASDLTIAA